MPDPVNLQPALERQLGSLVFQNTALQATNERLQAELTAKTKELAATKLALDVLPKPQEQESPRKPQPVPRVGPGTLAEIDFDAVMAGAAPSASGNGTGSQTPTWTCSHESP